MPYLFVPEAFLPEGVGFALFGPEHLAWLAVLCVAAAGLILYGRRLDSQGRLRLARALAYGQLALEILRDVYLIAAGGWMWCYLPLHPCAFTMFFMVLWARKPARLWGNLMYGFGLAGALAALLFCNWTNQPIWQFQTIYSFEFHGLLVAWILMLLLCGDIRPEWKGLWQCIGFLAVAVPLTAIANNILPDCNFFFTWEGSEGSPLEFLIQRFGTPWWLVAYGALALVLLTAEFLPWRLLERRKQKV